VEKKAFSTAGVEMSFSAPISSPAPSTPQRQRGGAAACEGKQQNIPCRLHFEGADASSSPVAHQLGAPGAGKFSSGSLRHWPDLQIKISLQGDRHFASAYPGAPTIHSTPHPTNRSAPECIARPPRRVPVCVPPIGSASGPARSGRRSLLKRVRRYLQTGLSRILCLVPCVKNES
jgi:hypothetical protein